VNNAQFLGEQFWVHEWTMLRLRVNNVEFMSEECSVSEWTSVNVAQFTSE